MKSVIEQFGPEMSKAVDQLIAEGIDKQEIHDFLEQLRPLTEVKSAEPIHDPVTVPIPDPDWIVSQSDQLECKTVDMPPHHTFSSWQATLINIAILAAVPALGIMVGILRLVASNNSLTIGFGPAISGGIIVGGSASVGIIFAPGDTFGFYGSFGALAGALASMSLTSQYTFMKGGMDAWAGANYGVTVAGGDVIVGSATLLMDENKGFAGVSFAAGIGIGEPLEFYVSYQKAFLTVKDRIDCGKKNETGIRNVIHITYDWTANQLACSGETFYWVDPDMYLRQGILRNGKFSEVQIIDKNWKGTQLVAQGEYIFWNDGDTILRRGKVEGGQIKDVVHLATDWTAKLFTADENYLYWLDYGGKLLRQGKVIGNRISEIKYVDHNCMAAQLVAAGGYLFWTDFDKRLRKGKVINGKLQVVEVLSTDWLAGNGKFAGTGNLLFWCDYDRILRQGEVG